MTRKTALVLGGGAMFGAYQAGVWRVLAAQWTPDLVVGASVGAINGWAMAGGCDPEEWAEEWLHMEPAAKLRFRVPWPPLSGVIDGTEFEEFTRKVHRRYRPRVEYALTATQLWGLRPRVFCGPDLGWEYLAASCGVPVLMKQYRLEGRWYGDGALLGILPLWAAEELGATHVVGVNPLPRWLRPVGRAAATRSRTMILEPSVPLGSISDSILWDRERASLMIQAGVRDASAAWPAIAGVLEA